MSGSRGIWNCSRVADLWWLVAGLRKFGRWDFDRGREVPEGLLLVVDDVRLTSLFGVGGGTARCWGERIGAPEPWEKAIDVESGPTLDRGLLPCCDSGRIESLLTQEPEDEKEVLGVSPIVLNAGSACLDTDCRLLGALGEATREVLGLWYRDRGGLDTTGECGTVSCCGPSTLIEGAAELVPGLEEGP